MLQRSWMWNLMNHLEQAGQHVAQLEPAPDGWSRVWNCIILSNTHAQNSEPTREHFHLILPQQRLSHHLIVIRAASRGNRTDEFGEVPKDCIDSISMSPPPFTGDGVRKFTFITRGLKQWNMIYWGGPFSDNILWERLYYGEHLEGFPRTNYKNSLVLSNSLLTLSEMGFD